VSTDPTGGGATDTGGADSRRLDKGELVFAGLLMALGVFILVDTATIEIPKAASNVGPRFFPYFVGILLTAASLAVVLNILRGHHAEPEEGELVDPSLPINGPRVAALIGAVLAFVVLVNPLGYLLATAISFFAVAVTLGARHYARLAVGSLVVSTIIYLAFTRGLGIYLPPGVLDGII
jgi:putative tricarboxylic transport membrane protein